MFLTRLRLVVIPPFQDYKLIYYKKEIERFQQYVEMPQYETRKDFNMKKIEEFKKIIESLESKRDNKP